MLREAEGERVYSYAARLLPAFAAGIVQGPVDVHVSGAQMAIVLQPRISAPYSLHTSYIFSLENINKS